MIVWLILGCVYLSVVVAAIVLWKANRRHLLVDVAVGAGAVAALVAVAMLAG